MKPYNDYDLYRVLDKQWESVVKKIDELSNEETMANDLDILAENMYQEFFIEPLIIHDEDLSRRSIKQGKIQVYIDPFFRDITDNEYIEVDGIVGIFSYPFEGDPDLFKCRASTFSLSGYPEITICDGFISLRVEKTLDEMKAENSKATLLKGIENSVSRLRDGAGYANKDVLSFNQSLKDRTLKELQNKKNKVQAFFDIANMLEVPVEKKEYAEKHIPLERKIVPIAHKYEKEDYYCIKDAEYQYILETIKHTATTYERTPSSYRGMQEEDLRNTLLAALNATYKGEAMGEAFRNKGKTDICVERQNRAAFVAECKMWKGKAEVPGAISQLDSYLTWRDCKTALIFFVRRKDFLKILDTAEETLRSTENIRMVKKLDKNEFECLLLSESNPGQQVKLRVMLFNLYCQS